MNEKVEASGGRRKGRRLLMAFAQRPQMRSREFKEGEAQPKVDYLELARRLREDGWTVDMVDPRAVEGSPSAWVRAFARAGDAASVALYALANSYRHDLVLSLGDPLAVAIALGHRLMPGHCRHVTTFITPTNEKKLRLERRTRFMREVDLTLVHTEAEVRNCVAAYGGPPERYGLLPLQVDHAWYRPSPAPPPVPTVCAAGVEYRDYRTLVEAARRLPGFRFLLNPQSPWSTKQADLGPGELPPNCEIRTIENGAIRDFYDEVSIVAVPLHDNDSAAGLTAILQGMSMAKPVVVTRTSGRSSVMAHGENCLLVPPGDADGWVRVLRRLSDDPAAAADLGRRARAWVESNVTVDDWVASMRRIVHAVAATAIDKIAQPRIEGRLGGL